jgi:hypothetical protein
MAMVVALIAIGFTLNDHGFLFLRASPQECELKLQTERQEPTYATSEGSVQRSDPTSKRATFCLLSPPSDNYRSSQTK